MELDERKKENFQWFSVSPLFRFPIEGDLISVWRSAAVSVTSLPDPDIWLLFQQTEGYSSADLCLHHRCGFVWGISGPFKRGFKVCFEQHVTLCGTKRENKGLAKKVCTFRDISAGLVGLCMCVHVFHCSFRCCQVTKCFQMFVFLVNVNPSAYQVLHSLSCSIFVANKSQ